MKLEDLQANAAVRGILSDGLVTVVSVEWFGSEALELTYKTPAGKVANELLYRHDEARLELVEAGRPWSFDGDGTLFRLISEAQRIRLAHLFDPVLAVPKVEELVATPYRHGGKDTAEAFFLSGMTQAVRRLTTQAHPGFPVTIYYAFKQSETKGGAGTASTGWETFLDAVIRSGFAITGTWPIRTERGGRSIGIGTNALASSIVLVCRRRPADAAVATRREFLTALRSELPQALRLLQTGNVAPVDLAQAAIGPGMGVYTRYAPFAPSNTGRGLNRDRQDSRARRCRGRGPFPMPYLGAE